MAERPTPPWSGDIPEGSFVSCAPTYRLGTYFDRFVKDEYTDPSGLKLSYYFYDPAQQGYEVKPGRPILIFLHGASNALEGEICINYTGAEMYASDDYQKDLGGAYILIPMANEYRGEDGRVKDTWNASYTEALFGLIREAIAKRTPGVGCKVLLGNSAGARMTFIMGERYPEYFNVLIPVGSTQIMPDEALDRLDDNDVRLFFASGLRDEFNDVPGTLEKRLPRLRKMKHFFQFTPEWVRNGDGGIASIVGGIEMGQHCLMNGVQANLMFDDGTPMDERLPHGMTGWLAGVFEEFAKQ